jgi:hypothetical protein
VGIFAASEPGERPLATFFKSSKREMRNIEMGEGGHIFAHTTHLSGTNKEYEKIKEAWLLRSVTELDHKGFPSSDFVFLDDSRTSRTYTRGVRGGWMDGLVCRVYVT